MTQTTYETSDGRTHQIEVFSSGEQFDARTINCALNNSPEIQSTSLYDRAVDAREDVEFGLDWIANSR